MRHFKGDLQEKLDMIVMEDYLEDKGLRYRKTTGSSGEQLNVETCPACGGSKWKVYLNAETGLGNCFHGDCEVRFNKFSFIRHLHGDSKKAAFKDIDDYCKGLGWKPAIKPIEVLLKKAPTEVVLPKNEPIVEGSPAHEYLFRRGFDDQIIKHFEWTYCEKGSWATETSFRDFSKRVIIPIYDVMGRLVTFQGRSIIGEEPKYLFPSGLPSTAAYIYNANQQYQVEHIALGEGVMDAAAMKMAFDLDPALRRVGCCATFGKHLSHGDVEGNDQLGVLILLKKYGLKRVTFMWDGEEQAMSDAIDAALIVKGVGLEAYVAELPWGCDPNETKPEIVRQALRSATSISKGTATALRMRWHMLADVARRNKSIV